MAVIRISHQENYVVINKTVLEDPHLSFKAKGLWAYCMSRPNHWEFHVRHLATVSQDKRDGVYSAIKELELRGYVRKVQKKVKGKFAAFDYEISEIQIILPLPAFPGPANPPLVSNDTSKTSSSLTPLHRKSPSKPLRSKKTAAKAAEEEEAFKNKKAKEVLTNLSLDEQAHLQKTLDRQLALDRDKYISEAYKLKVIENFRKKESEAKDKNNEHLSKEREIEINRIRAKAVYDEFLRECEKWIGKITLEESSGNLFLEKKGSIAIISPCQSTKSWQQEVDTWRVEYASW